MADNTLDQVNFAIGGDIGPYKAALSQAEAATQSTAAKIRATMGASVGGGAGAGFGEAERAVNSFGAAASKSLRETHVQTSTATREFRALFDEFSSGRTRMVPGTLAIIATRVFGLNLGTIALGASVAALPIAFGVAAYQAEQSLSRIQRALALTGNAAGTSAAQIQIAARQLDQSTAMSIPGAQGVMAGLAAHGNVPGSLLPSAAQAASGLSIMSGEKINKATEELEKALAKPAEGAKMLNDDMKLLSAAQTREVDDLVNAGQTYEAQKVIIDALNDRTKDAVTQLGGMAGALATFGKGLNDFWHNLGTLGSSAPADRIAHDQAMLAALADPNRGLGANTAEARAPLIADIAANQGIIAYQQAVASGQGNLRDNAIQAGVGLRSKLDVAGLKSEEKANAEALLKAAIPAATEALRDAIANHAAPGVVQGAREDLSILQTEAANAANPAYRWGSGVPRGHTRRGANPELVDLTGQSAIDNAVKDQLNAELSLTKSVSERYAIQLQINEIEERAKNTSIERELAEKHITGAAAQQVRNAEAAAERDKNLKDARDYQWALQDQQNAYDKTMLGYRLSSLQSAEKMATTEAERRRIQAQILAAEQQQARNELAFAQSRNPNLTPAQKTAQMGALVSSQGAATTAFNASPITALNQENQATRDQIALLQVEQQYKYADASLRAKEIADIQARIELQRKGFTADQAGYAEELAQRTALLEKEAEANVILQGQTDSAQMLNTLRTGIDNVALSGLNGFNSLRDAVRNFALQLAQAALQLYILKPLLASLTGTGTTPGGLLGQLLGMNGSAVTSAFGGASGLGSGIGGFLRGLGSLIGLGGGATAGAGFLGLGAVGTAGAAAFGGGFAAGGYIDPSKFYLVGENGPELFAPGISGSIIPNKAPITGSTSGHGGPSVMAITIQAAITGNGDKELQANMKQIAEETSIQAVRAAGKAQARTNRGQMIQANRRALV